ncbi:hypothetical protein AB0333_04165 [Citricoccus sp. NPDC079358]|uniref:hypothetical protein n=1 Tax=Citricoccus sp. NPDC079358 TaxID=3154653 RepID=UPI00344C50A3
MSHDDLLGALDGTNPPVPPAPAPGGRPSSGSGARSATAADRHVCSRKGCGHPAAWRLEWNNPRIHTPERRKTWLACEDHRDWLADYLQSRGLLKDVLPLAPTGTDTREKDS